MTKKMLVALVVMGDRNITRLTYPTELDLPHFARVVAKKDPTRTYYLMECVSQPSRGWVKKGDFLYTWEEGADPPSPHGYDSPKMAALYRHQNGQWVARDSDYESTDEPIVLIKETEYCAAHAHIGVSPAGVVWNVFPRTHESENAFAARVRKARTGLTASRARMEAR